MKKLILTCLLVLAAAAGMAQETAVIDGVKYLLDGGKASVMQQSGLTGDIVIPETVRHAIPTIPLPPCRAMLSKTMKLQAYRCPTP